METLKKPIFNIFDRGFRVKAFYGKGKDKADAYIEVRKNGRFYKRGRTLAYRVYNIAAHFSDMVDNEIEKDSVA